MVDGKTRLLRDDYCDVLGDCPPVCPAAAISFVEHEAAIYNEATVQEQKKRNSSLWLSRNPGKSHYTSLISGSGSPSVSRLSQWPVQIKLVPVNAPYFDGAKFLIAADCTAYAYEAFHEHFIRNHITLIGCPKLDSTDYSAKLTEIIRNNNIKSIRIVRMEVPCCSGLEQAVKTAIQNSGKILPWQVTVISTDGQILDD